MKSLNQSALKTIIISAFALFLAPFLLTAQNYHFIHLNGPDGCRAEIIEDEKGNLYMPAYYADNILGETKYFYRSTDGGASWQTLNSLQISILSFLHFFRPGADGNLYFSDYGVSMKSIDQGSHWDTLANISLWNYLVLPGGEIINSDISGVVQWSDDGAKNWKFVDIRPIVSPVFSFNKYTKVLYAIDYPSNSGFIMYSKNYGQTWEIVRQSISLSSIKNLSFNSDGSIIAHCIKPEKAYRSDDDGVNWSVVVINGEEAQFYEVSSGGRIYGSNNDGFFYSDDNGFNWSSVQDDGHHYFYHKVTAQNRLFAIREFGSIYSIDPVTNRWNFSAKGASEATVIDLAFLNENKLISQTEDGTFLSEDGGLNWKLILDLSYHYGGILAPFKRNFIQTTNQNNFFIFDGQNLDYFTQGGAQRQVISKTGVPIVSNTDFWVNPVDESIYFSTTVGIFRSQNFGQSWKKIHNRGGDAIGFTQSGKMIFNQSGYTWVSSNGGDSFDKYPSPVPASARKIYNQEGYIAAIDGSLLYISFNEGKDWELIPHNILGFGECQIHAMTNDGTIFATNSSNELWVIKNRGKQSEKLIEDRIDNSSDYKDVLFVSPFGRLYYTPDHDGVYKLNETIVSTLNSGERLVNVEFLPNPVNNNTNLIIPKDWSIYPLQLIICDLLGKIVLNQIVTVSGCKLTSNDFSKGVYIYQLQGMDGKPIVIGKLVFN